MKRTFRNDSIEDINKKKNIKIHGHGYPGLRSGKSGLYLKERAGTLGSEVGTLVFQPHYTLIVVGHCVLTASTISK